MSKCKKNLIEVQGYTCNKCSIFEWQGSHLVLEMDHIDGDTSNNDISNLRLLCPNCHSQTNTFRGKNIKKARVSDKHLVEALACTANIRQALIKTGMAPKSANYVRAGRLLNLSYETPAVDSKNSQFGTIWINNSSFNKKIKRVLLEEYEQQGWVKGRLCDSYTRQSMKGRFWVTNGVINRMVFEVPDNWWRGRVQL